jgi:hypothetical protein
MRLPLWHVDFDRRSPPDGDVWELARNDPGYRLIAVTDTESSYGPSPTRFTNATKRGSAR